MFYEKTPVVQALKKSLKLFHTILNFLSARAIIEHYYLSIILLRWIINTFLISISIESSFYMRVTILVCSTVSLYMYNTQVSVRRTRVAAAGTPCRDVRQAPNMSVRIYISFHRIFQLTRYYYAPRQLKPRTLITHSYKFPPKIKQYTHFHTLVPGLLS